MASSFDPAAALAAVLAQDEERVVRLWRRGLELELHELQPAREQLRAPLAGLVGELVRLLRTRGGEAAALWPEVARSHGRLRYEQHFDADDLLREFKVLHRALIHAYARRRGGLEPAVAGLLAELCGEAAAAAGASYAGILRREEVRFREAALVETLLHRIDVGLLMADASGVINFVTPPVGRLLGVPPRVMIGLRAKDTVPALLRQLGATHPDGRPFRATELPWVRVLAERAPVRGVRVVLHPPPAHAEEVVEVSATPLLSEEDGQLVGVVQTFMDRTEDARREQALSAAYAGLQRLQGRLLQRSRTQALGQLASGAAHALNNQLNVLRLRLQRLRYGTTPEDVDTLDRTVSAMGGLVAQLQALSSLRPDESLGAAPLDTVVHDALALAAAELEPLQVETVFSARFPVRADVDSLRELVVHLLLAARDRMEAGGKLRLVTRDEEGGGVLSVEDGGPALSPQELVQLFDPLVPSVRPQLALLLAAGRSQLERWGGQLLCESIQPGTPGLRFTLRLARAQPEPEAAPAPPPSTASHAPSLMPAGRGILVVDDDVDNADALAGALEAEGYRVRVAHSAEAALAAWDHDRFAAALLDAVMPNVDGWTLAGQLRARSPEARLAIVTGGDVRGQSRERLALVDAVFRKPLDVEALDEFLTRAP